MFFFRKQIEKKINRIEHSTEESFSLVKQDTRTLFQWVQYLQYGLQLSTRENRSLRSKLTALAAELKSMPSTPAAIKRVVDSYYSFESLMKRIRAAEQHIHELDIQKAKMLEKMAAMPANIVERVQQMHPVSSRLPENAGLRAGLTHLQERVMRRITRNSKEYIKGQLRQLIHQYAQVSALHLREIVVEQQNLCSKSSFYRLLEDIEHEEDIGVTTRGKEKIYLSKQAKNPLHHRFSP